MVDLIAFESALNQFSDEIRSWENVIHIGYFDSVDALVAASLFAQTFQNLERPFVLFRTINSEEEIKKRGEDRPYLFLGGSSDLAIPESTVALYIPIPSGDKSESEKVINAKDFGFNYSSALGIVKEEEEEPEITISLLVREICLRMDPSMERNLLPLIAEQSIRMMSEPAGLHKQLASWAEDQGLVTHIDAIRVFGAELFGVVETIETSYEPFFPTLTNNRENIKKFLRTIKRKGQRDGINLERGNDLRKFSELTKEELIDLNKSLFKHLMQNSGYKEDRVNYFSKKLKITSEKIHPVLSNTWDYARALKDAMNKDNDIMALSVLLGNRGEHYEGLSRLFASQRSVLNSLFSFFKPEDVEELKNIRYFAPGDKVDWFNAANIAVMLLSSGMTTIDLPLAVIVPGPKDLQTIAIRMSSNLELKENLRDVILAVVDSSDVGVMIRGDKYSSQLRVPNGQVDEFLQMINRALGDQDEI